MMNSLSPLWTPGRAEKYLLDVFKKKQIALRAPIDVEKLAKNCDAAVLLIQGLASRGVEGATGKNNNPAIEAKYFIAIDAVLAKRDYRMTLAEEVCHIIFDQAELCSIRSIRDSIELHVAKSHSDWLAREFNREMLGRIVLMPSDLLLKELRVVYPCAVASNGFDDLFENIVCELAIVFEVPQDGVRQRLKEANCDLEVMLMRAIGNRELKLPKSVVGQERDKLLFDWGGIT